MNLHQLRTTINAIDRMDGAIHALSSGQGIETAIKHLSRDEVALIFAAMERILRERRDNMAEYLKIEGVLDEQA
jgi:hypothetical protein